MEGEYIIINKANIQKRIDELEEEYKSEPAYQFNNYGDNLIKEIMILNQIISQSTPLESSLKNAFDAGREVVNNGTFDKYKNAEDYISNIKIDI